MFSIPSALLLLVYFFFCAGAFTPAQASFCRGANRTYVTEPFVLSRTVRGLGTCPLQSIPTVAH